MSWMLPERVINIFYYNKTFLLKRLDLIQINYVTQNIFT